MKTLILFGSARTDGHTQKIVKEFSSKMKGTIDIVDAYRLNIGSCTDCRACYNKPSCIIEDDMQEVYNKIDEADNIIIASPVYFHSITGELKRLIDRCQVYWAGNIRGDKEVGFTKKGGYILTAGAPRFRNQFLGSQIVCEEFLKDINVKVQEAVFFANSDKEEYTTNCVTIAQIDRLVGKLN